TCWRCDDPPPAFVRMNIPTVIITAKDVLCHHFFKMCDSFSLVVGVLAGLPLEVFRNLPRIIVISVKDIFIQNTIRHAAWDNVLSIQGFTLCLGTFFLFGILVFVSRHSDTFSFCLRMEAPMTNLLDL